MTDAEFIKSSILEILVPRASELDIEDILQSAEDDQPSTLISSIQQRELLFFDESLPVYAILRTTYRNEQSLKSKISRIAIGLEAHAVSSAGHAETSKDRLSSSASQPRDVVWSGKVDVSEDPVTVILGSAGDDNGQTVLLVWKTVVVLGRPRIRLQAPAVLFKVSASLQPALRQKVEVIDPYLPSGVPLPSNILQPLKSDLAFRNIVPQLASIRGPSKSPVTEGVSSEILPLKVAARRACRAVPALSSRIRVQRAPFRFDIPTMIASLEIDVPTFAQYPLQITSINVILPQGKVEEISDGKVSQFPKDVQSTAQGHGIQTLDVVINVSVIVSEDCHPRVQVRFKANVDFSRELGQTPKAEQQRGRKQDSVGTSVQPEDQFIDTSSNDPVPRTQEKMGITVKFTSKGSIYVGEPFQWEVFVMNQSGRQRRLGLSMLHKRKPIGEKRLSSRPSSINAGGLHKIESVAEAVTDDNLLYTTMKTQNQDTTQLICLNTDVKIGPLNPGSCFSTDMEFRPLTTGILHVDAMRLTDYMTNEAVDIRDLPDILALERNRPV